jgi:hypothetical protein
MTPSKMFMAENIRLFAHRRLVNDRFAIAKIAATEPPAWGPGTSSCQAYSTSVKKPFSSPAPARNDWQGGDRGWRVFAELG